MYICKHTYTHTYIYTRIDGTTHYNVCSLNMYKWESELILLVSFTTSFCSLDPRPQGSAPRPPPSARACA